MRYILMGIGSELQGDDGVGNKIAREFKSEGWLSLQCETVPENFAGVVEREKPQVLVLVDAAEMGIAPGEFRLLPKERLNSTVVGTHGMPLKQLVSRLERHSGKIFFIGVQPGKIRFGENLSAQAEVAKRKLLEILEKREWSAIKKLG